MTEPTLPPLPPEREMGRNRNDDATVMGYTADQLRAYALAAIEPYRRALQAFIKYDECSEEDGIGMMNRYAVAIELARAAMRQGGEK